MPSTNLPILGNRFRPAGAFAGNGSFRLLPFRFIELDSTRYLLTNFAGEHHVLDRPCLERLIHHQLQVGACEYDALKSKHFILDDDSSVALDLLATKYRTKQSHLSQFTSLFLYVVTLRCDYSCPYCQVSRQSTNRRAFDMPADVMGAAVDFMFRSPSPTIKVEFQGGEPLLNFERIQDIVRLIEERNQIEQRQVQFVIATNLSYLTDEILEFAKRHDIYFSTSLDGPRDLHNTNRPRPGNDGYEKTIDGIKRVRDALGPQHIAALMTTTQASLKQPREIIDEYVRQGFDSVFLRPISPYGFARRTGLASEYNADDWLIFYREALAYILDINAQGQPFREEYSSLLLQKILTPYPTGYIDLQSPAGIGISCLVFNYDGDIYASDEARMLAEMGDRTFRLGNLRSDTYQSTMLASNLVELLDTTMTEGVPMCSDCGFQPYCGSDPVQHHATQSDPVGYKPTSAFCHRQMGVLRHLFQLLEDNESARKILTTWI